MGADGILVLQPSCVANFRMRIFNADGSEANMCGNGLRCLVRYIDSLGLLSDVLRIETGAGIFPCTYDRGMVSISWVRCHAITWGLVMRPHCVHHVDTGVPHAVLFVEDIERVEVQRLGAQICHHELFAPEGSNATFVARADAHLAIRTYERGVEGETLACSTAAVAAALVSWHLFAWQGPYCVQFRSGDRVEIHRQPNGTPLLRGSAGMQSI